MIWPGAFSRTAVMDLAWLFCGGRGIAEICGQYNKGTLVSCQDRARVLSQRRTDIGKERTFAIRKQVHICGRKDENTG